MPSVHFLLNDATVVTDEPGGLAVLDFVRRRRGLTGTNEGCKEGDCGACTVLVGELSAATPGGVRYRPMTSCLMPLAEAHGRHVVTVEGIDVGRASTVQRAIVDAGASQCGFCTPGIAVSLTATLLDGDGDEGDAGIAARVERALSGHLCRCTGYRSLKEAGATALGALAGSEGTAALVARGELPRWFLDAAERLRALPAAAEPAEDAAIVAGGTDLYVQRGEELPDRAVASLFALLPRRPELRGVRVADGTVRVGALTSFEELGESDALRRRIPRLAEHLHLVASWQVRNRATVGGNLVNASPIGDSTVLFLALGARVVLEGRDGARREVPLARFYRGYKQLDLEPGELLVEVRLDDLGDDLGDDERVGFEKVSKRRCLDIATVNVAARLRVGDDGVVAAAGLAAGGVAPVPLALERTAASLVGRILDAAAVARALAVAQEEIAPIDDVRGSAAYKRLLVRNLLLANLTTLYPERFPLEALAG